ncbi:hypothetical protein H0O02_01445 [Candidatus Micrarchaeota archaeon]|nr:hypothetical protein [Candidatus Micrarchaeota archaeon]
MAAQPVQTRGEKVERIRGPELAVLVKRANSVPFVEGLRMAEEKGLVIASNSRLDKALVGSDEWGSISDVFACWSGTMTAYAKPGEKLGKTVEYVDPKTEERWVFPVPVEYQKEKNAILVAEHPDYKFEVDGKNIVVNATTVDLVAKFPASDGWHPTDAKHGIPTKEGSSGERYLWRIDSRVGPVARGYDYLGLIYGRRHLVSLLDRPSYGFGVAVEKAPGGGAPKVEAVSKQLTVREESGRLIVEGTPEQIAAAARLLDQLKQK